MPPAPLTAAQAATAAGRLARAPLPPQAKVAAVATMAVAVVGLKATDALGAASTRGAMNDAAATAAYLAAKRKSKTDPWSSRKGQVKKEKDVPYCEGEPRGDKGEWTCLSKCGVINYAGIANPPLWAYGVGYGSSRSIAKENAEKSATNSTPDGTRTRHCRTTCFQR